MKRYKIVNITEEKIVWYFSEDWAKDFVLKKNPNERLYLESMFWNIVTSVTDTNTNEIFVIWEVQEGNKSE